MGSGRPSFAFLTRLLRGRSRRTGVGGMIVVVAILLLIGPGLLPSAGTPEPDLDRAPVANPGAERPAGVGEDEGDDGGEPEWEREAERARESDTSSIADESGRPREDLWRAGLEAFIRMPALPWNSSGGSTGSRRPIGAGAAAGGRSPEKTRPAPRERVAPARVTNKTAPEGSALIATAPNLEPAAAVAGTAWTQIGPAPLRISQVGTYPRMYQGTGPVSGAVVDIAIDPTGTSDQTVYIATGSGGVWKTTNGGAAWRPLTDTLASSSIGAVALDPVTPATVWVGTGNAYDGGSLFSKGVGLYRSLDGGATWVSRGSTALGGKAITRLAVPTSATILAATTTGLYRSTDSGSTFTQVTIGGVTGQYISDLQLDTASPATTLWAAVGDRGVYRSTNAGSTWTLVLAHPAPTGYLDNGYWGQIRIAQSKSPSSATLYAMVAYYDAVKQIPAYYGLFRSTNTGTSWTAVSGPGALPFSNVEGDDCQCGYNLNVGVDPQDANRVYLGFQRIYGSRDGGATFGAVLGDYQLHWDQHAFRFSPSTHWGGVTPTRFWVGNDGGVASSVDGGQRWTNLNAGIGTNLMLNIDIGRDSGYGRAYANEFSYGGAQDTGIMARRKGDLGADWWQAYDGDGREATVDPTNPLRAFYIANGTLVRTLDGGESWAPSEQPVYFHTLGMPFTQPGVLFAGSSAATNKFVPGTDLYRRGSDTTLFSRVGAPANFGGSPGTITAIAPAPNNANVVYVGFASGEVRVSTNALAATPTWSGIGPSTKIAGQRVQAIAVDPTNAAIAVVVYAGLCGCAAGTPGKHVFRTTNSAGSWADVSGTVGTTGALPNLPVYAVTIDPNPTTHTIIIGGEAGVMRATSYTGTSWTKLGTGLPLARITDLALDYDASPAILRVATYGRSAWQLTGTAVPTVSSFTPASGSIGSTVTITGTNLTGATQVDFNTAAAAVFTVVSSTQVTAVVPPAATTGLISVVTPGGTARSATNFTIVSGAPAVSSFTPTSGVAGNTVAITGTNLTGVTAVAFNGTAASFVAQTATSISATVPAGATTGPITVVTPAGTATSATSFVVANATSQLLLNPGFENGADPAPWVATSGVVTNSGLQAPRSGSWYAWLGGYAYRATDQLYQDIAIPVASTAVLSFWIKVRTSETGINPKDTLVLQMERPTTAVEAPAVLATLGTWSNLQAAADYAPRSFDVSAFAGQTVRVRFVAQTDFELSTSFLIDDASLTTTAATSPPSIDGFTPTGAPVGTTVTISGANFGGATAVRFNGTGATFTVQSSSLITATVPAGATSGRIAVTTPLGTATSAANFSVATVAQKLLNPGFEAGATSWSATSGVITESANGRARSGTWYGWLCGYEDGLAHTDVLYQTVTMPASYTSATLSFWLRITTTEAPGSIAYDTLRIQLRDTSGNVLATLATYSNVDATGSYLQRNFNLVGYAGRTVRVYLLGSQDSTLRSDFQVDDFALNVY